MNKDISYNEFIALLNTDTTIRNEIAALLAERDRLKSITYGDPGYSSSNMYDTLEVAIDNSTPAVKLYLYNYSEKAYVYSSDYFSNYQSQRNIDNKRFNIFKPYINLDSTKSFYQDLKDDSLKLLVTKSVFTKERARRNEISFDANAKSLKLDAFSLALFKKHLEASKKISGKDAKRYLSKLPVENYRSTLTDNDKIFKTKYAKVIWDNVNVKSLELSKYIINNLHGWRGEDLTTTMDKPFIVVNNPISREEPQWHTEVMFTTSYFAHIAYTIKLPLNILSMQIGDSHLHHYITGTKKKTAMSSYDIMYAIDKLKILNYKVNNNPYNCPYYQLAIDQILSELSRPENLKQLSEGDTSIRSQIAEQEQGIAAHQAIIKSLKTLESTLATIKETK